MCERTAFRIADETARGHSVSAQMDGRLPWAGGAKY
jgi:hypothetical protein